MPKFRGIEVRCADLSAQLRRNHKNPLPRFLGQQPEPTWLPFPGLWQTALPLHERVPQSVPAALRKPTCGRMQAGLGPAEARGTTRATAVTLLTILTALTLKRLRLRCSTCIFLRSKEPSSCHFQRAQCLGPNKPKAVDPGVVGLWGTASGFCAVEPARLFLFLVGGGPGVRWLEIFFATGPAGTRTLWMELASRRFLRRV